MAARMQSSTMQSSRCKLYVADRMQSSTMQSSGCKFYVADRMQSSRMQSSRCKVYAAGLFVPKWSNLCWRPRPTLLKTHVLTAQATPSVNAKVCPMPPCAYLTQCVPSWGFWLCRLVFSPHYLRAPFI